jgi:hypothetical protein
MGLLVSTALALCLWVLLWGLGVKSIDAFMLTALIIVTAATLRLLVPHLPGNRPDPDEPGSGGSWIPR